MRSYGLSRYAPYRHSSLYNRTRLSVNKQFLTKSNSANAARKIYQTASGTAVTSGSLKNTVSGIASSVSELSKAMSGTDREKQYDAAKSFVDSYLVTKNYHY